MGTLLLSRRSWSVHLVRGRPGGRFYVGSGGRPTDSSTWRAGMLSDNLAACPNMALRLLVIRSDTGATQKTEINGESTSVVWPTLKSRTAKEQNRTYATMMSSVKPKVHNVSQHHERTHTQMDGPPQNIIPLTHGWKHNNNKCPKSRSRLFNNKPTSIWAVVGRKNVEKA